MPYKNREDYQNWWKNHPGKQSEYNKNRTIKKRCPYCNKQITFRKDLATYRPDIHCKKCGNLVHMSKTLSANPNHDTSGGIRMQVTA